SIRSSGAAALVTVLIYTLIPALTPPLQNRTPIYLFAVLAVLGITAWRLAYAQFFVQPWFKQRALVVGAGWAGRTLAQALQVAPNDANPYRGTGYDLVGFVDDNPSYAGTIVEGIPVLGGRAVLEDMARALDVDEVILAITHRHAINEDLFDALLRCRETGIHVITMSEIYERLLGRVPVQHVGRDLYSVLPSGDSASYRLFGIAKRVVDVVGALAGVAAVLVLVPFIALANALTGPGPVFYRQLRVGKAGRSFYVYKFRSMVPDAEAETGAVWATKNDARVTPVGKVVRRTRLDELPQFINILRGEMSLIGPRPERPEFVEELAKSIPFYRARHAVRPGITGWAQVQYRYGSSHDDARIKLEYDLYYVKHASLLLDLRIFLLTIPVMLQFKGQ
ncbi:MAG: sugar transferase, partial [Anaerolineae bacterium]